MKIDQNIIVQAISHFGPVVQIEKCAEELGELQIELTANETDTTRIIDEMADVYVTLEYLFLCYAIRKTAVQKRIDFKLNRLKNTIENERVEVKNCIVHF